MSMILKQSNVIKDVSGEVKIKLPMGSVPKDFIKQADGLHLWYERPATSPTGPEPVEIDFYFYFVYQDELIPEAGVYFGTCKPQRYAHVYTLPVT